MISVNLLLEKGATYRKAEPGEFLFHEGAPASFYYQMVSGRVRWCNILDDGREILHQVVEAGECFGQFPLFDGESYAASAVADTPCMILRLGTSAFLDILRTNPEIHFAFSKSMVQHLRFKFLLTELQSNQSPEMVITKLIEYFNTHHKFICQDCNRLMLTRQQLANMTGLRVETVIRAIKQMEKDDRLSIVKGKVFVPADGI